MLNKIFKSIFALAVIIGIFTTLPLSSISAYGAGANITRLAGENRCATAVEISKASRRSCVNVVLASGDNYADALAGGPLAYALDAPILLVRGSKLDKFTLSEIVRLGAENIYILGGTVAVDDSVADLLRGDGFTVERIAGKSRFDTAVEIAKKLQSLTGVPSEVFFAHSHNYPDALAISGIAAIKGCPVLYIDGNGTLSESTAEYLSEFNADNAVILGGTLAIDKAAESNLKSVGVSTIVRIAGKTRYDTCIKINKAYADVFWEDTVCIATALDFPDALAGGVFSAIKKAPLVLVGESLNKEQIDYFTDAAPAQYYIFGGTGAVPESIAIQLPVTDKTSTTIATSTTSKTTADVVSMTSKLVNIRAGAGIEYAIVAQGAKGTSYVYLGEQEDGDGVIWYKIKLSDSAVGFVSSKYSKKQTASTTTTTTTTTTAKPTTTTTTTTTTLPSSVTSPTDTISQTADSLSDDEYIILSDHMDIKRNKHKDFYAEITSFDTLRIGHGEVDFTGSYLDIDNENITVYNRTTVPNIEISTAHGLEISDYISVTIDVKINADITISTKSGSFTLTDVVWTGCNGSIFAKSIGSELTDCVYQWSCADLAQDIWVMGDSYLEHTDSARFPYYLLQQGYDNWLASGYRGSGSKAQLTSFKNMLQLAAPKYAVWCLGMNDPDNGDKLNKNWEDSITEFLSLCDTYQITPILTTIPSAWGSTSDDSDIAVTRNNSYKCAWVRESGYRFIDFESAVASEDGTGWKDGLLSVDGVHPTKLGAQVLAEQFILDFPEITQ